MLYHLGEGQKIAIVEGKKTVNILVKEGLSDDELKVLGRVAFVKNAYKSITKHFNIRSQAGSQHGSRLYSLWPQNSPFKIWACGELIQIGHKTYLFIHQIYSVLEILPYERLVCGSLKYSGSTDNNQSNTVIGNTRTISASRPNGNNISITSQQAGSPDAKAVLPFSIKIIEPLNQIPTIEVVKIKKSEQFAKYAKSIIKENDMDTFTLSADIDKKSRKGRGTIKTENEAIYEDLRFKTFKEALLALTNIQISYYHYYGKAGMKWQQEYTCNYVKEYNTLLLCIKISLRKTIYLIKLIHNQDTDFTRYSFLYEPNGEIIQDSDIRSVCKALKGRKINKL